MKKIVIALGGNAILQAGQKGTAQEQMANVQLAAEQIAQLVVAGHQVVLTHGNGPQVGNILLQNAAASPAVPAMPLDICGAETQGFIGYLLQQSLSNVLQKQGQSKQVVTVVTQVVVDANDPAFSAPTKPIGPFYSAEQAAEFMAQGMALREDKARGGWRRIVASPMPLRICEREAVVSLIDSGAIIIAAGGGGIPVVETAAGLRGVEAVIDKDLAGQRLANDIGADILLILTDVEAVALDWGLPTQRFLHDVSLAEANAYQAEGHFQAGSMGPKVAAACNFLAAGGEMAIITSLQAATQALAGKTGTRFTR
ncbi:MAG TPA: carbamate kinase [Firmicutes bacterium]|nr:carbamate kinase [Bacillota bacterium]